MVSISKRCRGFTMMELIIVILMLGALAIFAIPKLADQGELNEYVFVQEMISAVRFAQKTAIATGCDVNVALTLGGSYSLNYRTGGTATTCGTGTLTDAVPDPLGSGNYTGSVPTGVTVSNALNVTFDALGQPSAGDTTTFGGRTLTVEAVTGYVHE